MRRPIPRVAVAVVAILSAVLVVSLVGPFNLNVMLIVAIVAAVPDASILELGDWGIRPARWEELHLVSAWRRFMTEPASYFRHLLAD